MTRTRLRPAWTEAELRGYCPVPHEHIHWADHIARVEDTIKLAQELIAGEEIRTVADLSCGDAAIGKALAPPELILGDFAPGYEITGMIENTIHTIGEVDLFICSETVEHLDNPDQVMADIRQHARLLVLSTPLGEWTNINPQHYWGWDHDGIRELLEGAGWEPVIWRDVKHPAAQYQLWGCK